jgi:hypothetical protein
MVCRSLSYFISAIVYWRSKIYIDHYFLHSIPLTSSCHFLCSHDLHAAHPHYLFASPGIEMTRYGDPDPDRGTGQKQDERTFRNLELISFTSNSAAMERTAANPDV